MNQTRSPAPKLTIGMATYDDFDGVYFSIQAIRMYHPEVLNDCELLVVDNHPGSASAKAIQELAQVVPIRYVPFDEISGTWVKDIVFREARGEYVLCMDCHVMFPRGTLQRLLRYLDDHPGTNDLLQGPLLQDDLVRCSTHFEPRWFNGAMGTWDSDPRGQDPNAEPFEIPMQGAGVFACRRAAWPGYNPRFRGFATEEGYLHEKFRRAGGRCLCLPFFRWVHRFGRPRVPYEYRDLDRFRNLLVAYEELGQDFTPAEVHWGQLIGEKSAARLTKAVRTVLRNPFCFFDGVFCIRSPQAGSSWERTVERLNRCRVRAPIRRVDALAPDAEPAVRQALTHREIVRRARSRQWKSVMVFDEDIAFDNETVESLRELTRGQWPVLSVRGSHCESGREMQAIAYQESVFSRLLDELPEDVSGMRKWLEENGSLAEYVGRRQFGNSGFPNCQRV
jgi:hypothetical protein